MVRKLNLRFRRRLPVRLTLGVALGAAAIAMAGCVVVGPGNQTIYSKAFDVYIGQQNAQAGGADGYLVTLYRNHIAHRFVIGLTDLLRDKYDKTSGSQEHKAKVTLAYMRTLANQDGDELPVEVRRALEEGEWNDFNGAMQGVKGQAGRCIAVHLRPGGYPGDGENWTTRGPEDDACQPDMDTRKPQSAAYWIDGNGTDAEMWAGSCSSGSRSATIIHTLRRDPGTRKWNVIIVDAGTGGSPATIRTQLWRFADDLGRFGPTTGTSGTVTTNSSGFIHYEPAYRSPWSSYGGMIAKWRTDIDEGGKWYYNAHLVGVDFNRNGTDDCRIVFPYHYDTVNAPYKTYQWDQPPSKRDRSPPS